MGLTMKQKKENQHKLIQAPRLALGSVTGKIPKKPVFGTKEWAVASVNCVKGCKHSCRYCFARYDAIHRFKTMQNETAWAIETINEKEVNKKRKKVDGTVMFPTAHDITPQNCQACLKCIKNILEPGNNILIVSKPHLVCIEVLCKELMQWQDHILFRFTIGAMDDNILFYWEPGAPNKTERFSSLICAQQAGYRTSVSMEPVLDWDNLEKNIAILSLWITDSVWVGTMNFIDKRVKIETGEDRARVEAITSRQTDEMFQRVYHNLKGNPLVRWKESMKKVLGLPLAEEPGMDV